MKCCQISAHCLKFHIEFLLLEARRSLLKVGPTSFKAFTIYFTKTSPIFTFILPSMVNSSTSIASTSWGAPSVQCVRCKWLEHALHPLKHELQAKAPRSLSIGMCDMSYCRDVIMVMWCMRWIMKAWYVVVSLGYKLNLRF